MNPGDLIIAHSRCEGLCWVRRSPTSMIDPNVEGGNAVGTIDRPELMIYVSTYVREASKIFIRNNVQERKYVGVIFNGGLYWVAFEDVKLEPLT